jgi:hypothetical protein
MRRSLEMIVMKLSYAQREFLISHACGMRPFINEKMENATRKSLVERDLLQYEPPTRSLLGKPNGTLLTHDGREALCFILNRCADNLTSGLAARENVIDPKRTEQIYRALMEASAHWKEHDPVKPEYAPSSIIAHAYDRPAIPTKS